MPGSQRTRIFAPPAPGQKSRSAIFPSSFSPFSGIKFEKPLSLPRESLLAPRIPLQEISVDRFETQNFCEPLGITLSGVLALKRARPNRRG